MTSVFRIALACICHLAVSASLIGQHTDTIQLSLQVGETYSSYTGAGSCPGSGGYTTDQLFPEGIDYTTDEVSERNYGIIRINYTVEISPVLSPGTYEGEIVYTIFIGGSVCSERRKLFIIDVVDAEKPVVDFSAETNKTIRGGSINFLNHTENPVTDWDWDFGDGKSSSVFEPNHTYDSLGLFTVTLIASGPGGSDTLQKEYFIEVVEPGSPGTLIWSYEAEDQIIETPVIDDQGNIYFGCQDGNLYSINQQGTLNWKKGLGWYTVFTPVIGRNGNIYACFQGSGTLFSVDSEGEILWEFDLMEEIYSAPALGPDGSIYFTSISGKLFSVSDSGNENWSIDLDSVYFREAFIVVDGEGMIYVGKSNTVYGISSEGTVIWKWSREQLFNPTVEGLSLDSHGQVIVATDGTIYRLKDGITVSEIELRKGLRSPVIVGEDGRFIFSSPHRPCLTCLDRNGNSIWQHEFPYGFSYYGDLFCPVLGSNNVVYALSQSDTLYSIDGESGNIQWMLRMPHSIGNSYSSNPSPLIYNGQLILAGDNNYIYSVKCQSQELESSSWPAKYNNIRGTKSVTDPSPVVRYPANGSSNIPIDTSIIWSAVFKADSFEVQMDTTYEFNSHQLQSDILSGTEFKPNELLHATTYYCRVRSFGGTDTSKWSPSILFSTKPILPGNTINKFPPNGSVLSAGTIVFSWERQDTGKHNLVLNGGAEASEFAALGIIPYWSSKWGNWQLYAPGYLGQYAFQTNANDDPLSQMINIESYDQELNPYLIACGYSKGAANQSFRIGVTFFGLSSDSILSDTSLVIKYESDKWQEFKQMLHVPPGATQLMYTINRDRYSHIDGAYLFDEIALYAYNTRVDIQISETADFSEIDQEHNLISIDSLGQDIDSFDQQYFWRTRAVNVSGPGPWSEVWSFRTKSLPPDIPELLAPYNGESVDYSDLEFKWHESEYSDYYLLQLSQTSDFSTLEYVETDIQETSHNISLSKEGEYFWKVGAVNEDWDEIWSEVWKFTFQKDATVIDPSFSENPWIQIFPNPGGDEINVRYFLPEPGQVDISIMNSAGQEMVLVRGDKSGGRHHEKVFGNTLSTGMYFLQLEFGGQNLVEKFVIK